MSYTIGRRLLLGGALGLASKAQLQAQPAWPARPVRVILPEGPGGGNDTTVRLLGPYLEAELGQSFVVDNKGGAGGRIGVEAAYNAPADGYNLLFGNAGSNGINAAIYRDLPYDLASAFEPISLIVQGPNVLVVNRSVVKASNLAGLIKELQQRPADLNYASGGIGSSAHMTMELFKALAKVNVVHVPYRGTPAMAQSVISGDTGLMFANLVNVMPYIRRGEIAALAVTSAQRTPELPDIPTVAETLSGFETIAWNGFLAPRGTAPSVRERLHAALVKIKSMPGMEEKIRQLGGDFVASTPAEFAARIRSDIAKWKALAASADIHVE
jgi:tripartite-type tricarboxylate transporter receptor subunit TctC